MGRTVCERAITGKKVTDSSQKSTKAPASNGVVETVSSVVDTLVYSSGRHDVRIYGLPPNYLIMTAVATALLGIPLAIIAAMLPLWDHVGEFAPLKQLNSYIAPAINALTFEYRSESLPRFPLKRFMVASISMVEVMFLSNFFVLFGRRYRRHALLVWACYDRMKLFRYFGVSALIFCGLWYFFFVDWQPLAFIARAPRSIKFIVYLIMSMPFAALIFGHLTAIVGLGIWRVVHLELKRRRRLSL